MHSLSETWLSLFDWGPPEISLSLTLLLLLWWSSLNLCWLISSRLLRMRSLRLPVRSWLERLSLRLRSSMTLFCDSLTRNLWWAENLSITCESVLSRPHRPVELALSWTVLSRILDCFEYRWSTIKLFDAVYWPSENYSFTAAREPPPFSSSFGILFPTAVALGAFVDRNIWGNFLLLTVSSTCAEVVLLPVRGEFFSVIAVGGTCGFSLATWEVNIG